MPEVKRMPVKLGTRGLGLRHPVDLLPEGLYPQLNNILPTELGDLSVRNQITKIADYPDAVHSIRRLNDQTDGSFARIIGAGTTLYKDATPIDTGYSGSPLSMVPLRPPRSPRPWMYVTDANRSRKVRSDGLDYPIGIAPPIQAPDVQRGAPNILPIEEFDAAPPLAVAGTAGGLSIQPRFIQTISAILYDTGTTGWCSIVPNTITASYQAGARLTLTQVAHGTGAVEMVTIRNVFPAMASTTIAGILYDIGTSGPCSIVPISSEGIARDALLELGGTTELVRVLAVVLGVDGQKSFRCSTVHTHAPGDSITGKASFRTYTVHPFLAAADTITGSFAQMTLTSGKGWMYVDLSATPLDLSQIGGRATGPDDFLYISIGANMPSAVARLRVILNIGTAFPTFPDITNGLYKEILPADLQPLFKGYFFSVSDLIRIGSDDVRSLQTVTGVILEVVATAGVTVAVDSWWIGGTYGPNSFGGLGYFYYQRYRSSTTGAISNPSPPTRFRLDLEQEAALITPAASPDAQVDQIDLFRIGGALDTPRLIASVPNVATAQTDSLTDVAAAVNETLEFDKFQPFPVSDLPRSSTANVAGTTVHRTAGDPFNLLWQAGSQIIVDKKVYTLYAPPASTNQLELVENAGNLTGVAIEIPEATLGGRPLPIIWGPDPLTGVMFGCGHPLAKGTLFWTNPNDPDSASDANQLEITSPSEFLQNGFMYDGRSYVFSDRRLFLCYAQQLTDPNGNPRLTYAAQEVPNMKGLPATYGLAVGDQFWAVTGEGIFEGTKSITDETIYPLFPHGAPVGTTKNGYAPIDIASTFIRLFYTRKGLYFLYPDTNHIIQCLFYDRTLPQPGWFPLSFRVIPQVIYEEESAGVISTLMGAGGPDIADTPIPFSFTTPSYDLGDSRLQKLFLDAMVDLNPDGVPFTIQANADNGVIPLFAGNYTGFSGRQQIPFPIAPALVLHRNISLKIIGNRIPTTPTAPYPVFYMFEPNAVLQPYLATVMSSANNVSHGFTGYGHLRDGYFVWISFASIQVTILADSLRTYSFTLPSSGGAIRKQYVPLGALKGLLFYYYAASATPFVMFTEETLIRVKEWGSTGPYSAYKPFAGQSR